MAKPAHTRVTVSGVIGTTAAPVEHWSFNLNFPAAALASDATDAAADTKAGAVRSAMSNLIVNNFGSDVIVNEVRVAAVDATGHVYQRADGTYVQGIETAELAGSMAKQPMPLQTALCVSLGTNRAGPTGKGRFFLPWPALSINATTKTLDAGQVDAFIALVKTAVEGIQTAMGAQLQVVSSKGYMSEVTSLRIGRAPDTMRSRREDVPEGYVSTPLA